MLHYNHVPMYMYAYMYIVFIALTNINSAGDTVH